MTTYHAFSNGRVACRVYMLPQRPEDAGLELKAGGLAIRIEFTEETATRLARALDAWYATPDSNKVAPDEWVATDLQEAHNGGYHDPRP